MDWRGYFEQLSDTFIDGGAAGQVEDYDFYNSRNASWAGKDRNWLSINAGTSGPLYQGRDETKIYENPHVANWAVVDGKLSPVAVESFTEKARYIECANSNKYNITQTLAETFEVFCIYEYTCDSNGHFKKTYWDEYGNVWTGKKVVFFNRAVKSENPFVINYQHNLDTISRIIDSSEVYTKMYVNSVSSEVMDTGFVSISDTSLNPLLDDFILNFDYLYEVGSINDLQKEEIEKYKVEIHKLNKSLIDLEEEYSELVVQLNEAESNKSLAEASLASARESLLDYKTLRDNEVTNIPVIKNNTNSYSLVLVPNDDMDIVQGVFKLHGINAASIKGWRNNKYGINDGEFTGKYLFTSNSGDPLGLIHAQSAPSTAAAHPNRWYLTLDEYGYPATVFTSKKNEIFSKNSGYFGANFDINTGAIIYLELEYCPKNKYETICSTLQALINKELRKIANYETIIGNDEDEDVTKWTGLKAEIKHNELEREDLYNKKEALNFKLERTLGPALREGYWQPDTYDDPGEGHNDLVSLEKPEKENTFYFFDDVLFEGEQVEYYYDDAMNMEEEDRKYYSYIDLSSIYKDIGVGENKVSDFCITLSKPEYVYTLQNGNELTSAGKYAFMLDAQMYCFTLPAYNFSAQDSLILHTKNLSSSQPAPYLSIKTAGGAVIAQYIATSPCENNRVPADVFGNITTAFMGANQYLSSHDLYNNAGFVYAFLKRKTDYIPVALLQSENIVYDRYTTISYSFDRNTNIITADNLGIISNQETKYPIVYPRIFLDHRNVNSESENFRLYVTSEGKALTKYEDFTILLRKGRPYVTIKITDINLPRYILDEPYNIIYQVSRANEMLYLDAKVVAKDSSKPKYSYEIKVGNIPGDINALELGQLVHINDYSVDARKEYGYVSGLSYKLDKPSEDEVTISNYKTKFEDLFSSISAQNEAMKQNQTAYNIAAQSFTSTGEVEQTVLQSTLDNNDFSFNFSNTNITLDNTGGLILTNTTQYNNGVYGQVALRGGGIFCSNSVDENGDRLWSTGITPNGVNANLITTGQLDTNLIRIYAGDTLAFQWNSTGLYSYKETTLNGKPTLDDKSYIRLNEEGLIYVNNGNTQLDLGWEGLRIEGADGHVKLTGESGLQMFNEAGKPIVTFGKYGASGYGMFFTDGNGNVTLQARDEGRLELVDTLLIGQGENNNYAGLCGKDGYVDSILNSNIRFWAGHQTPTSAPITIAENGSMKATKVVIPNGGKIVFKKSGYSDIELTYDKLATLMQ